ncbi:PAP2 superfamily protein [Jejuia pallidilutea]|jgi:membrane-associated phospholipid phosphatase|uniref:PAP2 superfamily protein n=2 Tax=Jejuia pallidilutea TaxID=504487 RepID=A0A362X259_9FLAO|nr:PAP2 superfamily protein [Jejuia pallidilutea]
MLYSKLTYKITFLTTFLIGCFFLPAQIMQDSTKIKEDKTTLELLKHDTKQTLKSVGYSFTRPLHWKGKDFGKLGGLLVGTIALSSLDKETNRFFERNSENFPKGIRDFGWYFGSPQNYFITNAGLYGFGLLTKNEKIRKTSVLVISSSITNGVINSLLKGSVGRARPNHTGDPFDFQLFSSEPGYHSFPSGHTALSVTMSHAIAKQFDNIWVKIGVYGIGAVAPISRLVDGAHWLTDIAFSAALSIIVVDSIDKFLFNSKAYNYTKPPKNISWNFTFSANQIGLIGTF